MTNDATEDRVTIPGSAPALPGASVLRSADGDETARPTIVLRPPEGANAVAQELLAGRYRAVSREEAEKRARASSQDVDSADSSDS